MDQQNKNVYAPPNAVVADPEPEQILEKPKQVTLAARLLWIAVSTGIIAMWINVIALGTYIETNSILGLLFMSGFTLAVNGLVIQGISAGKNWARIFKLTTSSFSILTLTSLTAIKASGLVDPKYFSVLLLFTKPGSDWFRKRDP